MMLQTQLVALIALILVILPVTCEMVSEQLLIRPLEDGSVLTQTSFILRQSRALINADRFYHFPKAVGQIVGRFGVESFHLKLTSGRYRYGEWDYPSRAHTQNVTREYEPPINVDISPVEIGSYGASLFASFLADNSSVDARWESLQHALGGLICSSLQQIGIKHTTQPQYQHNQRTPNSTIRYGQLTREAVCTENLSPFLRLLPCRSSSGFGRLLHTKSVFDSIFTSLQMHVTLGHDDVYTLRMNVVVVRIPKPKVKGFSLRTLFGEQRICDCVLAAASNVIIEWPYWAMHNKVIAQPNKRSLAVNISSSPTSLHMSRDETSIVYVFDVKALTHNTTAISSVSTASSYGCDGGGLDLTVRYNAVPFAVGLLEFYHSTPPIAIVRYFLGSTLAEGSLEVELMNNGSAPQRIHYSDSLPWFLSFYFHTFEMHINAIRIDDPFAHALESFNWTYAVHRGRPYEWQMILTLPPLSLTTFSWTFEKQFLTINGDYPPDVNRGFDVNAAVVTLLPPVNSADEFDADSAVHIYSLPLLVMLPSPDFSMPFNVIAFTSTVMAFFFGSMFNLLYSTDEQIKERMNGVTPLSRLRNRIVELYQRLCKRKKDSDKSTETTAITADTTTTSEETKHDSAIPHTKSE